jgi:hypothetical protein
VGGSAVRFIQQEDGVEIDASVPGSLVVSQEDHPFDDALPPRVKMATST